MKNKENLQGTSWDAAGNSILPASPPHHSLCDFGHITLGLLPSSVKWADGSEEPRGPFLHPEIREQHLPQAARTPSPLLRILSALSASWDLFVWFCVLPRSSCTVTSRGQ